MAEPEHHQEPEHHREPEHHHVENPHAGQGPVLLDIGEDVGAVVVTMPPDLDGIEVEARRVDQNHHPPLHVGVVGRPLGHAVVHSAVFGGLKEGSYELYERPHGPVRLTVHVAGGEVTYTQWPPASP